VIVACRISLASYGRVFSRRKTEARRRSRRSIRR
jgi:hypothetical protein